MESRKLSKVDILSVSKFGKYHWYNTISLDGLFQLIKRISNDVKAINDVKYFFYVTNTVYSILNKELSKLNGVFRNGVMWNGLSLQYIGYNIEFIILDKINDACFLINPYDYVNSYYLLDNKLFNKAKYKIHIPINDEELTVEQEFSNIINFGIRFHSTKNESYNGLKVDVGLSDEIGHYQKKYNKKLIDNFRKMQLELEVLEKIPLCEENEYKEVKKSLDFAENIDIKMPDARIILVDNNGMEINNGWISVKDKLPENDDYVLGLWIGWDRMEMQSVVTYDFDEKAFGNQEGDELKIQYWRELPSTDGLKFDFGNN